MRKVHRLFPPRDMQLALLIDAVLEHGVVRESERIPVQVKLARGFRGWSGEQCDEEKAEEKNHGQRNDSATAWEDVNAGGWAT